MQNRAGNQRPAALLEGTPGIYQRRLSPPRLPITVTPVQRLNQPTTSTSQLDSQSSTSRSNSNSHIAESLAAPSQDSLQQRQSAARRPVVRSHPQPRELSSHSFSDATKPCVRKLLTSSHSIGNVTEKDFATNRLALSSQDVMLGNQLHRPNELSASLQSLPNRIPGSSILNDGMPETELPLPPNWAVEVTSDNFRYYVDHNNRRTHWIHPFAAENLPPGWTKIFDNQLGVVYFNENDNVSQFEHPGLATPACNIAQVHGSIQSITPQRPQLVEDVEDLNIISEEIPAWLEMYSNAPSDLDHLLDFNLFKLPQLEMFDDMLLKLFKQDAINTVIRFEKPRREINKELFRRLI